MSPTPEKWRRRESNEQTQFPNELQRNDLEKDTFDESVPESVIEVTRAVCLCPDLSAADPDLLRLLNHWSQLPDHIRSAINALVDECHTATDCMATVKATPHNGQHVAGGGAHA